MFLFLCISLSCIVGTGSRAGAVCLSHHTVVVIVIVVIIVVVDQDIRAPCRQAILLQTDAISTLISVLVNDGITQRKVANKIVGLIGACHKHGTIGHIISNVRALAHRKECKESEAFLFPFSEMLCNVVTSLIRSLVPIWNNTDKQVPLPPNWFTANHNFRL